MGFTSSIAPRWLSPGQAMAYMGVSKHAFRNVRGQLHPVRIPGMTEPRYDRVVIDSFMEANRVDVQESEEDETARKISGGVLE